VRLVSVHEGLINIGLWFIFVHPSYSGLLPRPAPARVQTDFLLLTESNRGPTTKGTAFQGIQPNFNPIFKAGVWALESLPLPSPPAQHPNLVENKEFIK